MNKIVRKHIKKRQTYMGGELARNLCSTNEVRENDVLKDKEANRHYRDSAYQVIQFVCDFR
jgi:hypothetical protein